MQANERKRILTLVENGTITAEEAIVLLEKLGKTESNVDSDSVELPQVLKRTEDVNEDTTSSSKNEDEAKKKYTSSFEDIFGKAFNSKEANSKVEDIVNELKKDLTEFGARMSTLFNTTFSKVKGFENDVPFGEKFEFKNNYAFNAEEVKGLDIDVPNGKVEMFKTTEPFVTIDVTVKTTLLESEEKTKEQFLENFVKLFEGKLVIQTVSKFSQVQLKLGLPEKMFDIVFIRSLNSKVEMDSVHAKILKVNLVNGSMNIRHAEFDHADLKTKNGSVETRFVQGDDLEAETVNGRIYIEGVLKEVEAESVNGPVVITTTSEKARKVKATTLAGSVELYVPKTIGLDGKLLTNLGKIDLGLQDISNKSTDDAMLQKVTYFDKVIEDANVLKIVGESRTGSVLVRYNP
jgi:DUF4097 and DUF4098 domain-containing protein YvlB